MSAYAARIRAARGFADKTQQQLADELGVDVQTIKRREAGTQIPKKGERVAIAAICGVPVDFLEHGFGTATRDEILTRLDWLEAFLVSPLDYADTNGELTPDEQREAATLLGPQLLAAAQALRRAKEREQVDTDEQDRPPGAVGGAGA